MVRLLGRKLLLILLLIPLLNLVGFLYATEFGPVAAGSAFNVDPPGIESASFLPQYRAYLGRLLTGDLGTYQRVPLGQILATPFKNSLALLGLGFVVTVVLGPALGLLAIGPKTGRMRPWMQNVLAVGSTLPGFFLGSLLIAVLLILARSGVQRNGSPIIPVQGFGLDDHLILPVVTLVSRPILYVAYLTAGLLENEFQQDYVRVARSKGLHWFTLVWRHALPNVVSPVVVLLGQSVRLLVAGLIIVEALFDWRGLGRTLVRVFTQPSSGSAFGSGSIGIAEGAYYMNAEMLAIILVFFGMLLLLADLVAGLLAYLGDPRQRLAD